MGRDTPYSMTGQVYPQRRPTKEVQYHQSAVDLFNRWAPVRLLSVNGLRDPPIFPDHVGVYAATQNKTTEQSVHQTVHLVEVFDSSSHFFLTALHVIRGLVHRSDALTRY